MFDSIAVDIYWDTAVKCLIGSVRWLFMLFRKTPIIDMAYGRHGEGRLCAYQMAGCFVPGLSLVWFIHSIILRMKDSLSMTMIILTCFVCLLAKQHTTLKWKDVISSFPVLQGSAETLVRCGENYFCQKYLKSNGAYTSYIYKYWESILWDTVWGTSLVNWHLISSLLYAA